MENIVVVIMALTLCFGVAFAFEHGGTELKEHGGTAVKTPTATDIHSAMRNYIDQKSAATGTFDIDDPVTGKPRNLKLERIHERVGKTGGNYYSCADFKDTASGDILDLDLDVKDSGAGLKVVDVRIHKVNGKERYTYDKNDNRIPVEQMK
ncbi:MAG: hypothetical protein PHN57_01530 [Candidatus Omnitrophica bacterium]|nr:hypothetical protein [Candidatus Omnitrophota bacterium]